MESEEQSAAQPYLRSEDESDRHPLGRHLDPDEASDEPVGDYEELDEE